VSLFGVPLWACALVGAALAPFAVRALASALAARARERAEDVTRRVSERERKDAHGEPGQRDLEARPPRP
jgi:hypothetical protein